MRCLSPILSRRAGGYVPCGNCYYCRKRKRFEWQTRILLESMTYSYGYFVTLTYDNDHLPADHGVNYKDARSFIEKFRKRCDDNSFSYYLMSEYGGRRKRPHYHMQFMTDIDKKTFMALLKKCWSNGFVKVGRLTLKSVKYVCKFHLLPKEHVKAVYPVPNFHIVSIGLGKRWFEKFGQYYQDHDLRYVKFEGVKYSIPNYIGKKLGFTGTLEDLDLWRTRREFIENMHIGGLFGGDAYDQYDNFCKAMNDRLLVQGINLNSDL